MTKIFLLILVAGFALCGSTPGSADKMVTKSTNPTDDDAKKAAQTVQTFMDLIAAGENDKAKALMFDTKVDRKDPEHQRPDPSEAPGKTYEGVPTFDWVSAFAERKYRLNKILSEHSNGDIAEVAVELTAEDLKSLIQPMVFELRKVEDKWKISDVDLIEKNAQPPPKSNGA